MIADTVDIEMAHFATEINRSVFYSQAERNKLRRSILLFADELWANELPVPVKLYNWVDYLNGV